MRIKNLFYALFALPLFFLACEDNNKVDEVKDPTVAVVAGEATENSVSFTITSTDANKVAWLVVEATATLPTATEIFAAGQEVAANKSVEATATELKAETEYKVVAAAMNSKKSVMSEATITTLKGADEPGDEPGDKPGDEPGDDKKYDVEITATHIDAWYENNGGKHNYFVTLGDKEFGDKGWGVDGGSYYNFDLYSSVANNGIVPNGNYAFDTTNSYRPLTVTEEASYGYMMISESEAKIEQFAYADAIVIVSDNKIEATIELPNGDIHHVVYEGSLRFDGGDEPVNPNEFEATHTATEWTWGGGSSYGNKYDVKGEDFTVSVHFPAEYATEDGLAAGEYIWTNTSWWGYNDFDNEFTTREFYIKDVDGVMIYASIVRTGEALVEKSGEEYHIQLTLNAEDGTVYMIEYTGEIAKPSTGGEDAEDVVFTSIEYVNHHSASYMYEYKLTNATGDKMNIYVNDVVATPEVISSCELSWISKGYAGNEGYFSTDYINVGGTSYKASSGSMTVETDASNNMTIAITLLYNTGGKQAFTFAGSLGGDNGGGDNGGGEDTQLTKLATLSVSGLVEGNAATVSWQEVTGAKDYTVTLNGTDTQTVTDTYVVYSNLAYSTTYSVSVVANPADATVNSASDAGTATITVGADPNAGGGDEGGSDDGGETAESYENWVFTASLDMVTMKVVMTDGTHTVACTLSEIAGATFYFGGTGALNVKDVTVNGVAAESASGTLTISTNQNYVVVLDAVINGVKYTGTSTNSVV